MWAALIPALLQAGSGVATGAATVEQNAEDKVLKKTLEGRAERAAELAGPLGAALLSNLLPGGGTEELYAAEALGDAAQLRDETISDARSEAWKYGGSGFGQSGGFMARSPYEYLTAATLARAGARNETDRELMDLYLTANDFESVPSDTGYHDTFAIADILHGLANIKY
jgi:hypothetical protein